MESNKRKKILVIEDNATNMFLFKELLETNKTYKVLCAYNGKSGIKLLKENMPDLLILDMLLPDTTGFEIREAMMQDPKLKKIKILAVSASATGNAQKRAKEEFEYFMEKPVDIKKFLETVDALINE